MKVRVPRVNDKHMVDGERQRLASKILPPYLRRSVLPDGVEAQSPDEFLCNLFDLNPVGFETLLREQAGDLVKPPMTFEELLGRLEWVVPDLVDIVRRHVDTNRVT
jgi:hypothetical protein